jgi:hypothetical protein
MPGTSGLSRPVLTQRKGVSQAPERKITHWGRGNGGKSTGG